MNQLIYIVCYLTCFINLSFTSNENEIIKGFIENDIVPDVIDSVPDKQLEVIYKKSNKKVNLGNEIAPVDVKEIPEIHYETFDSNHQYYTLILTDPDAPNRKNPIRREFRHWLVVNIPGNEIVQGETLTAYVGSGPPKGSGLHRYIFLLYKQPEKLTFQERIVSATEIADRPLFSTRAFAKKYHLELIAGNFYQAQYDDSVLDIQKQLGLGKPAAAAAG